MLSLVIFFSILHILLPGCFYLGGEGVQLSTLMAQKKHSNVHSFLVMALFLLHYNLDRYSVYLYCYPFFTFLSLLSHRTPNHTFFIDIPFLQQHLNKAVSRPPWARNRAQILCQHSITASASLESRSQSNLAALQVQGGGFLVSQGTSPASFTQTGHHWAPCFTISCRHWEHWPRRCTQVYQSQLISIKQFFKESYNYR